MTTILFLQVVFFFVKGSLTVEFIYSEKATNVCEIFTLDLSCVVTVKSTVEISENFVAFIEYMNFDESQFFCTVFGLFI